MYKILKRICDFFAALVALILVSPFFIVIIFLLKLTGEGEVWYMQKRIGLKNSVFDIWKFATMLKNSPNMGTGSLTLRGDPRVTPIGKYLRKSKVNELPQFINVILGNMSFVGPRPQMKVDFEAYTTEVQSNIYNVKPGITGVGSIIFRDEETIMTNANMPVKQFYKECIAPYKGAVEIWYQQNVSFRTDLILLFLTGYAIVVPENKLIYKIFKDLPTEPDCIKS